MKKKRLPRTFEEARAEVVKILNEQIRKYPHLKGHMMCPVVWNPEGK